MAQLLTGCDLLGRVHRYHSTTEVFGPLFMIFDSLVSEILADTWQDKE
jgi:hypothetical protein